jgi:DNA-binding NarL/FixJ family response regulator
MSISIAIVEDEARIRDQLLTIIEEAPGFTCLGAFNSGEQGLREIPRCLPDVVLMDINLPKMSGVECTARIKKLAPTVQIIMLTVYEDIEQIFSALKMGASGYLLKRTPPDEILKAVAEVYRGGAPMSGLVARQVVQSFVKQTNSEVPNLSPREAEVLALVAKGYINKEIAEQMSLSLETVRSYLKSVYDKLHVRSRTEAAMKYFQK